MRFVEKNGANTLVFLFFYFHLIWIYCELLCISTPTTCQTQFQPTKGSGRGRDCAMECYNGVT